tara:strand:- start:276 stop:692 length:417 start_codon:yes stop_codon:yes gene_type:complete
MPKGRPKGSKNKPKEVIAEKKRGRPAGSKNTPKVILPPTAESTVEPIHGFQDVMRAFGEQPYMAYCNIPDMELKPDDMPKAVERYHTKFAQLPKRIILHERNEHLLPYLYAHVPELEAGLTRSTAIWEMKLQIPREGE